MSMLCSLPKHINKKFDFTPLNELGVNYDSDNLDYVVENNKNQASGTKTITAIYQNQEIDKETVRQAKLSYTHEYDRDQWVGAISEEGLEILDAFSHKPTVILVTKEPDV